MTDGSHRCEFCGEPIHGTPAAEPANGVICKDCHNS